MKKLNIISAIVVVIMFISAALSYSSLPAKIASHWNVAGEVNGYMSSVWIFLVPVISLLLLLLFIYLPRLDPLRDNYKYFQKYYNGLILMITLFFLYIFLITLAWNLGYKVNIMLLLVPALAILFFYTGIMIQHTRRNWFVGIRTPWTISSDIVWNKTHRLGGLLFKISAVISLIGLIFPVYAIWFIVIPIVLSAIFSLIYSYFLFRNN